MSEKVTGKLTTFREQDQSEKLTSHSVKCVNRRERNSRRFAVLVLLPRVQLEQYFILKIQLWKTNCEEVGAETEIEIETDATGWFCWISMRALSSVANLTLGGATNKVTHNS